MALYNRVSHIPFSRSAGEPWKRLTSSISAKYTTATFDLRMSSSHRTRVDELLSSLSTSVTPSRTKRPI